MYVYNSYIRLISFAINIISYYMWVNEPMLDYYIFTIFFKFLSKNHPKKLFGVIGSSGYSLKLEKQSIVACEAGNQNLSV